ncbi:hypothetical protein ASF39_12800 [Methylobacterium sp. Leaf108]|nr:hypothetical protein ASF39_12800 [Methylobacterium sp. Leaf108]
MLVSATKDPKTFLTQLILAITSRMLERPEVIDAGNGACFITIVVDEVARDEIRTLQFLQLLDAQTIFDRWESYLY